MRRALALLALVLLAAGCSRTADDGGGVATAGSGAATPSATAGAAGDDGPDTMLKYSQCMRENGMGWFPDPDSEGRLRVRTPKGMDPKKIQAAEEACKKYAPNGGEPGKIDPAELEQVRKMAQCMRESGVPNFPDPQPNGGIALERDKIGGGPGDPTFDKAEEKCSKFMPDGTREKGGSSE